jgi:hypothetical protein
MYRSPLDRAAPAPYTANRQLPRVPGAAPRQERRSRQSRIQLLFVSLVLTATIVALLEPAPQWGRDVELAQLLRGMGAIKALLTLGALAAIWWRLGRPVSRPQASAYLVGGWSLVLANALIWELTAIGAASALYHMATLGLLVLAWRDPGALPGHTDR